MTFRDRLSKLESAVEANDVVGILGVCLLGYGTEQLCSGLGFALAGGVMVYAALRKR